MDRVIFVHEARDVKRNEAFSRTEIITSDVKLEHE
jgi:hypothetical protein